MATSKTSLGTVVMKARRMHAMTQAQLAALVGVSIGQVSRIENDLVEPRSSTLMLLAEVLALNPAKLGKLAARNHDNGSGAA